jgi:hypothetical protein
MIRKISILGTIVLYLTCPIIMGQSENTNQPKNEVNQSNQVQTTNNSQTSPQRQPNTEKTSKGEEKKIPIEFEIKDLLKNIDPSAVIPGAYYYGNEDDDPTAAPKVGTDGDINFIEISSIRGNSKSVASTRSILARWVQIPPNAPERIKVTFKTKVSKNNNYDWATPGEAGRINRRVGFNISFLRQDGLEGGGLKLGAKDLTQQLDKWVPHSKIITIPKGAKHMKISASTSGGFNLALGDWRIE